MPCFCKHISLATLTPGAPLAVRHVPPQFGRLLTVLQLEPVGIRSDEQLVDALPAGGQQWLRETLSRQAPGLEIPIAFPPAGGPMMVAMLRITEAANIFPLHEPDQFHAAVEQASASLEANLASQMRSLAALRSAGLNNMATAARLTLALRAKGICPTTLTGVEAHSGYADSAARMEAVLLRASEGSAANIQPFGLTKQQLAFAQNLSGVSSYLDAVASSNLPPMNDPGFVPALRAQIDMLATLPDPKSKLLPEEIGVIADLDVIIDAFGENALSPEGVDRVNMMLDEIAKMDFVMSTNAETLSAQLFATPDLSLVLKGLETIETAGHAIAASVDKSLSKTFGVLPVLNHLEMMTTLSAVLEKAFGKPALGPCNACTFPIDDIAANLARVTLPEAPSGPAY